MLKSVLLTFGLWVVFVGAIWLRGGNQVLFEGPALPAITALVIVTGVLMGNLGAKKDEAESWKTRYNAEESRHHKESEALRNFIEHFADVEIFQGCIDTTYLKHAHFCEETRLAGLVEVAEVSDHHGSLDDYKKALVRAERRLNDFESGFKKKFEIAKSFKELARTLYVLPELNYGSSDWRASLVIERVRAEETESVAK